MDEIIYSDALSYTVSAADEMDLVNARRVNPFSRGMVVGTSAHVASYVLKVDDEVYADSWFWCHSAFLLGTI